MQRDGTMRWFAWVIGLGVVLGCEDGSETSVNFARPDSGADAGDGSIGNDGGDTGDAAVPNGVDSNDASVGETSGRDASADDSTPDANPTTEPGKPTVEAGTQDTGTADETWADAALVDSSAPFTRDGSVLIDPKDAGSDAGQPSQLDANTHHTSQPDDSTATSVSADAGEPVATTSDSNSASADASSEGTQTDAAGSFTSTDGTSTTPSTSIGLSTVEDAGSETGVSSTDECNGIPEEGVCVDDVLQLCVEGVVTSTDCSANSARCVTLEPPAVGASCIPELDASTEQPEADAGRVPPDLTGCTEVNLSTSAWSVFYVDSEEIANPAEFVFDGNLATRWQSAAQAAQPHELVLDLGQERALLGLTYWARQDASTEGMVAQVELYASVDAETWYDPVMAATLANTKAEQFKRFSPVTARYVRLVVLSAHGGGASAAIAELKLLGARCPGDEEEPEPVGFEPGAMGPYLNGVFPSVDPATGGGSAPATLSQTGAFTELQPLVPHPGLMPYDVNQPLWSDRASKSRWIALPNDGAFDQSQERITFDDVEPWRFPAGTVFVKHFELGTSEINPNAKVRLETRFLVVAQSGAVYGLTYRWNDAGTEASLLSTGETRTISIETSSGSRTQTWTFPARADCDHCHNSHSEYVLGVNAWQLNKNFAYPNGSQDNQLARLRTLGAFNNPFAEGAHSAIAHAVSIKDTAAPIELRLKSYMAANCSHCHRPNAVVSQFDARFEVPLEELVFLETEIASSVNDYVVKPGSPLESELFQRDNSLTSYGMPPIAKSIVDKEYVDLLQQWISSL